MLNKENVQAGVHPSTLDEEARRLLESIQGAQSNLSKETIEQAETMVLKLLPFHPDSAIAIVVALVNAGYGIETAKKVMDKLVPPHIRYSLSMQGERFKAAFAGKAPLVEELYLSLRSDAPNCFNPIILRLVREGLLKEAKQVLDAKKNFDVVDSVVQITEALFRNNETEQVIIETTKRLIASIHLYRYQQFDNIFLIIIRLSEKSRLDKAMVLLYQLMDRYPHEVISPKDVNLLLSVFILTLIRQDNRVEGVEKAVELMWWLCKKNQLTLAATVASTLIMSGESLEEVRKLRLLLSARKHYSLVEQIDDVLSEVAKTK